MLDSASAKQKRRLRRRLLVHVPFSVYLGWITIASIANVATALVSVGWDGFGLSPETWAILVLAVALIIALAMILTRRDIAYTLVIVWALAGIAINQSAYANIVLTAEVAIVIIVVALVATWIILSCKTTVIFSMNRRIFAYELAGIVFIIFLGSLLHFTFEFSGGNPVVGVFSAVNESIWEHLKLAFWPTILFALIELVPLKRDGKQFLAI